MGKAVVSTDHGHPTYVAAFEKVTKALEPLDDTARQRILLAVAILLSIPVESSDARRR